MLLWGIIALVSRQRFAFVPYFTALRLFLHQSRAQGKEPISFVR